MAIVETTGGKIDGLEGHGLQIFKGIAYAAAPVGERRWLAPQPHDGWSGVRDAKRFSNAACQNAVELATLPILAIDQPTDEDCLYLNVFTPGLDGARPVMVWIHGGGFTIGAGTQMMGDAMPLATRGDVVVVTINYRLGALGFLNLNEVTHGAIPATGNEGLLDQIAALEWVRDNIASFGGDRDNVTVFGESAGGMSVGCLLGMPAARGLFHKAIPQSGSALTANPPDATLRIAERMLELFGTRDPDALRALSAERVMAAQAALLPGPTDDPDPSIGSMPLQPNIDAVTLPRLPLETVARGDAAGVAILVGTTRDEWKLFSIADPKSASLDDDGLRDRLSKLSDAARIVDTYRAARDKRGDGTSAPDLLNAIETDRVFRMPAIRLVEAQQAHDARVFCYLVTWESPFFGGLLGACHAIELGPLFGLAEPDTPAAAFFGSGPEVERLSVQMQDAWTAFARTGDPSCDSLGRWPAYERDRRSTMLLGADSSLEASPYDDERCAWDGESDAVLGSL